MAVDNSAEKWQRCSVWYILFIKLISLGLLFHKKAQLCTVKKHEQFITPACWSRKRQAAGYSRAFSLENESFMSGVSLQQNPFYSCGATIDGHSMQTQRTFEDLLNSSSEHI